MHRDCRRGFTIWELLAVIGVCVLLVVIIMPAITKPRVGRQSVVAQSNLRSLNTGAWNYAVDHEDLIFSFTYTHSSTGIPDHTGRGMTEAEWDRILSDAQDQNILQRNTGRI